MKQIKNNMEIIALIFLFAGVILGLVGSIILYNNSTGLEKMFSFRNDSLNVNVKENNIDNNLTAQKTGFSLLLTGFGLESVGISLQILRFLKRNKKNLNEKK